MLGYGFAGICRDWLVYPSQMKWPGLFATTTLLNTLHNRHDLIANVNSSHNHHSPIADGNSPHNHHNSVAEVNHPQNHHNRFETGWTISRYGFLWRVTLIAFLWYFIPGYVFPALSTFAFITWIFPHNVIINQMFGMTTGMALLPITFDWSQITGFLGSPLTTPWFAAGSMLIGFVLWEWIVCPILHFSNVWEGQYFPLSSYCPD
jgi:hypothetical protein